MLDSVKILRNVASVNVFDESDDAAIVRAGMANDIYFRLWQSDRNERYAPASGATMSINFPRAFSVGSSSSTAPAADQSFSVSASNPFPGDLSIWKISLTAPQSNLVAGGGVQMTLVEGLITSLIFLPDVIRKLSTAGV